MIASYTATGTVDSGTTACITTDANGDALSAIASGDVATVSGALSSGTYVMSGVYKGSGVSY
jgi:hypothetical protein